MALKVGGSRKKSYIYENSFHTVTSFLRENTSQYLYSVSKMLPNINPNKKDDSKS